MLPRAKKSLAFKSLARHLRAVQFNFRYSVQMSTNLTPAQQATLIFQRFGLGAKPGGMSRIVGDPAAALANELNTPGVALINVAELPSYAQACVASEAARPTPDQVRLKEYKARIVKHLEPEIGFVERLVIFWSNHFTMSMRKAQAIRAVIGQCERDVIRRNVLGTFPNMLREMMTHPGMIRYLDNDESIGEESAVGLKKRVSYTENLAREAMELHTVGTGSFTESDVKALAKMLTGWTYARNAKPTPTNLGQFTFRSDWHQPGPQSFFGVNIPEGGMEQALAAFDILAAHPSTARKIATKLLRHFITDQPTEAMIAPLVKAYLDTRGDLKQVVIAMLTLPEALSTPMQKIRTPYEMVIAMFRAVGAPLPDSEARNLDRILTTLNQPTWDPPSPEGFADETATWLSPNGLAYRLDAIQKIAKAYGKKITVDPASLATSLYGATLSGPTRERVAAGGSQLAGLTILFASPEFQRR